MNAPVRVRAPGRVNLIGEHVDYSEGFVLPVAIDRATTVTATPRADRIVEVRSAATGTTASFGLDDPDPKPRGAWSDYAEGVARALARRVPLGGATLEVETTLPLGAGLSSSAAFEVSVALALATLAGASVHPRELAKIGREAENGFVGLRSGIMDQLASACGVRDHALLIDCRSEAIEPVLIPADAAFVVADSGVKHALAGSAYNDRRAESEEAARRLGNTTLRDVDEATFRARESELPEPLRRRARHVVSENARVLAAADALRRGDLPAMGALMNASHASLRDDYEVSVPELDALVAAACALPGVDGARMTGGGFGGAIVVLARRGSVQAVCAALERRSPLVLHVNITDGAAPLS